MKIIIFSDSHGSALYMRPVMAMHSDADVFVHLGDGAREFEVAAAAFPGKRIISVAGNCDTFYPGKKNPPPDALAEFDGFIFYFTHGHRQEVKNGVELLLWRARELNADAVFHGHTHVAYCEYIAPCDIAPRDGTGEKPLYLVCPGSISLPRRSKPSYAVAETYRGQLICRTAEV